MQHIWKLRLGLILGTLLGLGVMMYFMAQTPANESAAIVAFLLFFVSAMVLLATTSIESAVEKAKSRECSVSPEHHVRSTGGGGGGTEC